MEGIEPMGRNRHCKRLFGMLIGFVSETGVSIGLALGMLLLAQILYLFGSRAFWMLGRLFGKFRGGLCLIGSRMRRGVVGA